MNLDIKFQIDLGFNLIILIDCFEKSDEVSAIWRSKL